MNFNIFHKSTKPNAGGHVYRTTPFLAIYNRIYTYRMQVASDSDDTAYMHAVEAIQTMFIVPKV